MTNKEKAQFASKVFCKLLSGHSDKLQKANQSRNKIVEQINNGQKPTGYRYKFLKDSSWKVVDLLAELALQFNKEHPDDVCTVLDFVDILNTTIHRIETTAKKK